MARGTGQLATGEAGGRRRASRPIAITNAFADGSERTYYRDEEGRPHRDDGAAVVERNPAGMTVAKWYCQHGVLHRDRGAAVTTFDDAGLIDYEGHYKFGKLHRTDGPAEVEYLEGNAVLKCWRIKGQRHRDKLPALIKSDPLEQREIYHGYYQLDQLHREDGPAESFFDGWSGEAYRQRYMRFGLLHREDGPALIELDRDDGSLLAVGYFEQGAEVRRVEHFADGRIKREIWPEDRDPEQPTEIRYHLNGELKEELWIGDGQLHRVGAPARIIHNDSSVLAGEEWFTHGQLDREDGPAKTEFKGNGVDPERQEWWRNGQLHREDGPAVVLFGDENKPRYRRYYLHGEVVKAGDLPGHD